MDTPSLVDGEMKYPFDVNQSTTDGAHPTVLARWRDLAVGLAAEDDVLRLHAKAFREPGAIGLADPELGIAPGASHTLEWSLYPMPRGDYWAFVNALRRNSSTSC